MATVKYDERDSGQSPGPSGPERRAEPGLELADFEQDEKLRRLRLDEWFVMADEGMPLWVC